MTGEKYPAKLVEKFNDALVMVGVNLTEYEIRKVIDAIPYAAMREALAELLSLGEVSRYNSPHSCDCHVCTVVKKARAALRAADGEET